MRTRRGYWVPTIGLSVALIGLVAPAVLGDGPNPGGANNQCDGYCSQFTQTCVTPLMRCCCKITGTWTCVCRAATDCTTQNDCQDGGGQTP